MPAYDLQQLNDLLTHDGVSSSVIQSIDNYLTNAGDNLNNITVQQGGYPPFSGSPEVLILPTSGNIVDTTGDSNLQELVQLPDANLTVSGPGNLLITSGSGDTIDLSSTLGNDSLITGSGDTVYAGHGADTITAQFGSADSLYAGDGYDQDLYVGGDNNQVFDTDTQNGGGGNDTLEAGGDHDTIKASDGVFQTLKGDGEYDSVYGGGSHDTLYGGGGFDTLTGIGSQDMLYAAGFNDSVTGSGGQDTFYAGSGGDHTLTGGGNDTFYIANQGNDTINTGFGSNAIDLANSSSHTMTQDGSYTEIQFSDNGQTILVSGAENQVAQEVSFGVTFHPPTV